MLIKTNKYRTWYVPSTVPANSATESLIDSADHRPLDLVSRPSSESEYVEMETEQSTIIKEQNQTVETTVDKTVETTAIAEKSASNEVTMNEEVDQVKESAVEESATVEQPEEPVTEAKETSKVEEVDMLDKLGTSTVPSTVLVSKWRIKVTIRLDYKRVGSQKQKRLKKTCQTERLCQTIRNDFGIRQMNLNGESHITILFSVLVLVVQLQNLRVLVDRSGRET